MFRAWIGLIFACAALGFQQPSAADPDVYAIYSQLLTNPRTSHGADDNEVYLIGGTTVPGYPAKPCVDVPPDRASMFAEVLADYNNRKDVPAVVESAFQISKPYRVLRTSEISEFAAARAAESRKVTDFFLLTDVYFDHGRRLALTAIATWCGGLCGSYQWRVFEKTANNKWQERRWVSCTTIARDGSRRGAWWLGACISCGAAFQAAAGFQPAFLTLEKAA